LTELAVECLEETELDTEDVSGEKSDKRWKKGLEQRVKLSGSETAKEKSG
jgi:hypothetical protein